eukprot:TRINITY_DN6681_c0_g1_i3.p1 TRINITY_DN6681_c0_g1~~TRINITY_DN6681_c0_g1_i3.p1  ORF type:complete len:262 (+),score=45.69 TRINITY_DN6681_c0_g1_i3:71-856(+)
MKMQSVTIVDLSIKPQGLTLVVPALSIGSVSQLAADLLIESFELSPWLSLCHDAMLPVIGNMKQGHSDIATVATASQARDAVYASANSSIAVLQLRSSIIPSQRNQYRTDLVGWAKSLGFERVLVLAGTDASQRIDQQLTGVQMRWVLPEDADLEPWSAAVAQCANLGLPSLERREPSDSNLDGVYLPSAGMTRTFLKAAKATGLPAAAVVIFVNEGDNVQNSITLTSAVIQLLQLPFEGNLKAPSAWDLLYGTGFAPALF